MHRLMTRLHPQAAPGEPEPANALIYTRRAPRSATGRKETASGRQTRAQLRDRNSGKPCGHVRHRGACPCCQRIQLARWQAQLAEATSERTH